ncbi:MAG: hypothetical protein IKI57_05660 [Clostridia bacterium]|nr:hypothetical protein [Clostridia bacterium]
MAGEGKDAGISESGKKVQNIFKKVVDGCIALVRFIRTGIGIVVLKIVLIVLLLIFIYILAEVIFASIAKLIGIEGPGANEARSSTEYLNKLSASGYDAMLSADQLLRYYTYEYAVLMDVGEYLEEVGVSTIEKQDEGEIDWSSISREEWAILAAHGFAANSNYSAAVIATVPNGWVSQNPDYKGGNPGSDATQPAPSGEFYYRITNNEYTKEKALMPYFRITRNDYNLRYYFEFDNGLHDDSNSTTFGHDNAAQQSMARIGSKYNIIGLEDTKYTRSNWN